MAKAAAKTTKAPKKPKSTLAEPSGVEADLQSAMTPKSDLQKLADALGMNSFKEQEHGWPVMISLMKLIKQRMTLAEKVCYSIAQGAPPEETKENLQSWASLMAAAGKEP